jgi:hypothetical protein
MLVTFVGSLMTIIDVPFEPFVRRGENYVTYCVLAFIANNKGTLNPPACSLLFKDLSLSLSLSLSLARLFVPSP